MKFKIKQILSIFKFSSFALLIFGFSCKKIETSTEQLEKYFSREQIKDLTTINSFFVSEILKNKPYKDGIKEILETLHSNGFNSILRTVDYEKQKKLYRSISETTFNEIWEIKTDTSFYKGEQYILPKHKGAFFNYLEELSASNNELSKICFNKLEASGDLNLFTINNYVSSNFNNINFNDFNNQLIISIYFLTAIDDYEREPKRKKRIKDQTKKVKKQFQH
jgi:hypothetical protein